MTRQTRDEVVALVTQWQAKTGLTVQQFIDWLGISRSKYYDWMKRQGQANQHNAPQPKQLGGLKEHFAVVNWDLFPRSSEDWWDKSRVSPFVYYDY